jgi:hypothetical protein
VAAAHSRLNAGHIVASWGQREPQWERAVFALEPGELSPVIETKNGYEVVILENRVDAARPELEKVRKQIEQVLLATSWSSGSATSPMSCGASITSS